MLTVDDGFTDASVTGAVRAGIRSTAASSRGAIVAGMGAVADVADEASGDALLRGSMATLALKFGSGLTDAAAVVTLSFVTASVALAVALSSVASEACGAPAWAAAAGDFATIAGSLGAEFVVARKFLC